MIPRFVIVYLAFATLLLAGCGGGPTPPPLHPVTGTVLKKDKPISAGTVQFRSTTDDSLTLIGDIDSSGKFVLSTLFGGKRHSGAPLGAYQVTVILPAGGDNRAITPVEIEPLFTVVAGDNAFTIPLEKKRKAS